MIDWVSVKDRLPEHKQGKYLVTIACGCIPPFVDFAEWSNRLGDWQFDRGYVTAWQEISEPYKENKE